MRDFRERLFEKAKDKKITACLYTEMDGIVSGIAKALTEAERIGLVVDYAAAEGEEVLSGDMIMQICGTPPQICVAEDMLIGCISKFSGIATAARAFVKKAGPDMRVICGSWKKLPVEIKAGLRTAVETGGGHVRIADVPMVYLDKNYVAMFGGIQASLTAAACFTDRRKVVQIKGRFENGDIVREAWTAVAAGADIIYVDSGRIADLKRVTEALRPMLEELKEQENYRKVEFAFGGGVRLEDMEAIREAGADIVGVGRAIADAPLLDLRMEVTNVADPENTHAGYDLLDKSELTIEGVLLRNTNLTELAKAVSHEIGISAEDIFVIDVRDGMVTLDILQKSLDAAQFIGKERAILKSLEKLQGVTVLPAARIRSNGMLGWIAVDEEERKCRVASLEQSKDMALQIAQNISRRVIVFPTGIEVEKGEIEDTNTPLIINKFTEAGFAVDRGEVLKDDLNLFSGKLKQAAEKGYGVAITTGGVGAENKDYSVEAVLQLDPEAAAPYIAKFKSGHGRHSKDGIRIAVGRTGFITYIALPGPNDEVSLCIDTAVKGIVEGWSKELLAGELARILRERLREKIGIKEGGV